MELWNSVSGMTRLARLAARAAVVLLAIGAVSFPFTWIVGVPSIVLGMTSVLCALFAWFRLDHLRELERQP